jgi:hypothetical protein
MNKRIGKLVILQKDESFGALVERSARKAPDHEYIDLCTLLGYLEQRLW